MHSAAGIAAISNSTSTDRQLFFGLMLGRGDQSEGALSGIEAALDEINARNDLLSGYTLNYYLINSQAVSILRLLVSQGRLAILQADKGYHSMQDTIINIMSL